MLRADPALEVPPKFRKGTAKVFVEEISQVPDDTPRVPNKGFTFFTTEDSS